MLPNKSDFNTLARKRRLCILINKLMYSLKNSLAEREPTVEARNKKCVRNNVDESKSLNKIRELSSFILFYSSYK